MTFDPFADAPADEAQAAPAQAPAATPARPVAAGSEGKVVVTLKGGAGFDAPWVVVHAADVEDAIGHLSDEKLRDLLDRTKRAGGYFAGGSSAPQGGGQQRQAGKPEGADQAPGGEERYCKHGQMQFKSGVSKSSGKAYKGFFCSERDRNEQCKPEFIK
ncbi:hypothetical protein [Amycolatopsis anabasis]|uniref:hypothetical protein n=1 Tax=Amycolatopsis anabasis TaxID=1840409 RepID=UPI00131BDC50|nr:hypothetical protein [Amycolatopsis anabasis]